jgi:hypothetical protein
MQAAQALGVASDETPATMPFMLATECVAAG